ncbi:MAG: glycosyltransferase [Sphingopyxis sp.]|uniref:glycosyltransferase family 2 protein n=1 Tax=Sphingopyxis sp. TaxID=1908224 RepID=UPI002AB8ECEB|nr:glycosyltransferase [Sphingopyxis sp.]MDZ3832628.1 glycosyltransferase [Sphingopyxis sp.]
MSAADSVRGACRLMVATPIYDGAQGSYVRAALDLALKAQAEGVAVRFEFILYQPDVSRARNMLSAMFLASDCTHLLFVDADIDFAAEDIFAMLRAMAEREDCAVLGAACPRRMIHWGHVARAVETGVAAHNPADLARFGGEFALHFLDPELHFSLTDLVELTRLGTGLMLIRRDVLENLRAAGKDLAFRPDPAERQAHGAGEEAHAFFQPTIDPDSRALLSEDYAFCRRARAAGFRIWLAPWVRTTHSGPMIFRGSLPDLAQLQAANSASSAE